MPKVSPEHFKKRREEILDAARRVFSQKGFEPTTMQDIVNESGMSRGGVYQYFSSTEEMFIAIREESLSRLDGHLNHLLTTHDSVWEALETYVDDYSEVDPESLSFALVSYEYTVVAWRNQTHRDIIYNQAMTATTKFKHFLQKGVEHGEFDPLFPLEAIVLYIFNITDGLILYYMLANQDEKKAYIKEHIDGLKLYLKAALQIKATNRQA